jgi:hypothetical protein
MEDEKPDTSHLVLKPKVVEPTDKVATPGDGTAISVQGIHQENALADEKRAARKKPSLTGEAPKDSTVPPGFKVQAPKGVTAPPIAQPEPPKAAEPLISRPPVRRDGTIPPGFKRKEIVPVDAPAPEDDLEGIRVHDILQENREADDASGANALKPKAPRKTRRLRDFLLLVGTIDVAIAVLIKVMHNPMMFIYGVAGITLVTATVAWIMFVVMDAY